MKNYQQPQIVSVHGGAGLIPALAATSLARAVVTAAASAAVTAAFKGDRNYYTPASPSLQKVELIL